MPPTASELMCPTDLTPTRIKCAHCGTPICPSCYAPGPVGMTCQSCAHPDREAEAPSGTPGWLAPAAVAVLVLAAIVLAAVMLRDPGSASDPDLDLDDPGGALPDIAAPSYLGQDVAVGRLTFVVSDVRCTGAELEGSAEPRLAQGRWCYVELSARNDGREPSPFVGFANGLLDAQGRSHGIDPLATDAHPGNEGREAMFATINPGNTLHSVLVYDVPVDVDPVAVQLMTEPGRPPGAPGFSAPVTVLLQPSPP